MPSFRVKNSNPKGPEMEAKECFYQEQFGYCWLVDDQWMFQAVDQTEVPLGEPLKVVLADIVFHHDQDEELH
jgi:hypothetical protein